MANTLATPSWTLKEVARGYMNNITFVKNVNRTYDDRYVVSGAKVGDTVKARLPQRFTVTDGSAYQEQALYDQTVPIQLTSQKNVAFGYSSQQATLELQEIRSRYVNPAADALAAAADVFAFSQVYRDVYNAVGSPGQTINDTFDYLEAGVKLTDLGAPDSGRVAVLDQYAMATIANAVQSLFNPSGKIGDAFEKGVFGTNVLGFSKWLQDSNCPVHTTGTFTACTPVINGANQTGSTLITNGWASGASSLKKGDVFTVAGVYSVHPQSYQSTGRLQQFVVTADTSDSGGAMATLPISPSIITSGQLQTVSGSPANGAAITVLGATSATSGTLATTTSKQSMLYHPDAFAFVTADLEKPNGGAETARVNSKNLGLAIRMVEQYSILTDKNASRLDILIGAATVQARLACRAYGA